MNSTLKKIISVVLSVCMVISVGVVAFAQESKIAYGEFDSVEKAADALAKRNTKYPLIVCPGINHSPVYLCDDDGNVVYDEDGNSVNGTTFIINTDELIPIVLKYVLVPLIYSLVFQQKSDLLCKGVQKVVDSIFKYQTTNPDGSFKYNIQLKDFHFPLSEFDENSFDGEYDKAWFYRQLPLQRYTEVAGEDRVYLYPFNLVGNVMDSADGLDEFIQFVKKETGSDKVNLINVSLGGTVFTAYMDRYVDKGDLNEVVNVVAVLDGTKIMGDFYNRTWNLGDRSIYSDIFPYILSGDDLQAVGYLINLAIRIFPRESLGSIITAAYDRVFEDLLHNTSQIWAMMPSDCYPPLAEKYLADEEHAELRKSTQEFYNAQKNLVNNLKKFMANGGQFNAICACGLQFGEKDYNFFALVDSYDKVNSDGIIQIESTSLGATSAVAGEKLSDEYISSLKTTKYLSPDKTIDASTCAFPDNVWFFVNQHHEIGGNDVALRLAAELIFNDELVDVNSDPENWPQFNSTRNTKWVTRSYFPKIETLDRSLYTQGQLDELDEAAAQARAMMERTVIDPVEDEMTVERLRMALVDMGLESNDEKTVWADIGLFFAKAASDIVYIAVGPQGYSDRF